MPLSVLIFLFFPVRSEVPPALDLVSHLAVDAPRAAPRTQAVAAGATINVVTLASARAQHGHGDARQEARDQVVQEGRLAQAVGVLAHQAGAAESTAKA